MTTEIREDMTKATREQIRQLAKVRHVRFVDAAVSVASSFAANLADSRGSSMEPYWEAMTNVADGIVAQETGSR